VLDLVLLRHGQSTWNAANLFTGWVDVDLTEVGEAEAKAGGELLATEDGLDLRILHTSVLTRAIRTAEIALHAAGRSWLPIRRDWRLNERHYGDLQGKNKAEIKEQFGEAQLKLWRRSYDTPPPVLSPENEYDTSTDLRYRSLTPEQIPQTECLADVVARVLPYWEQVIVPDLQATALEGSAVLVAAHGNSIRALRKFIEGISDEDIVGLDVPTGIPYRLLLNDDLSVHSADFLGDPAAAAAAGSPSRITTQDNTAGEAVERRRPGVPRRTPGQPTRLQGVRPAFSGAHSHHRFHGDDPDLAVTDLAGGRCRDDGIHHFIGLCVVHEDLDADLRNEVHFVLRTSVDLGVAPLAPKSLGLGQGHPLHPEVLQDFFDVIEFERLEDSNYQLHPRAPFACGCD
jgi:2,3-bisphosphoglycerate-dependent phosphoglycerate mutase